MRYVFIKDHQQDWPVRLMCHVLKASVSGYYRWRGHHERPPSVRQVNRLELIEQIRLMHARSHAAYGSPRVHRALRKAGRRCTRRTVERLMRQQQIRSRRTRRWRVRTTDSNHRHPIAPNTLDRKFTEEKQLDQVWVADITYVPTGQGWLYLAAVMDLCSRRIVGFATADHLRAELPIAALRQAIKQRHPNPSGCGGGCGRLMHHSDRGVQYACRDYQQILTEHDIECSMSRRGDCYDNAAMESFFKTLKAELIHHQQYRTKQEANASIHAYIELFYNRQRLHSALGYQSPAEFEANRS
jgi:transposase InsO family protein